MIYLDTNITSVLICVLATKKIIIINKRYNSI